MLVSLTQPTYSTASAQATPGCALVIDHALLSQA